jgi:hypothetical protein
MGYNRNTAYTRCLATNNPLSNNLHEPLFALRVQVQTMCCVICLLTIRVWSCLVKP